MRKLFLYLATNQIASRSLSKSEILIKSFPKQPFRIKDCEIDITDYEIDAVRNTKLRALLKDLEGVRINGLRNKVVHKQAYRPHRNEVKCALRETRRVLFSLSSYLKLHDDINWYSSH